MTKFNVIQKKRRAQIAETKRQIHGDPLTRRLKSKPQTTTISGKRKRKLFKKWRRDQKEAVREGVITMEDVEMAVAQPQQLGAVKDTSKGATKFHMKRTPKLSSKQLKRRGKKEKKSSKGAKEVSVDSMVEE